VIYFQRDEDFIECEQPLDLKGNATVKQLLGYGCTKVNILVYVFKTKA